MTDDIRMAFSSRPHRRYNPLTGEWILVSPHRARRPWQGKTEILTPAHRPAHDLACYLCPGNVRANGEKNPKYAGTFVFDNDFAALLPDDSGALQLDEEGLLVARDEKGVCRVVCFSPRHDLTLADMTAADIIPLVETWTEEYQRLGALSYINHVQIFENKGDLMGCSNPHPHGQIWAQASIPVEPLKEMWQQRAYHDARGRCLLCDYLALELRHAERVVSANDEFVCLVPFWAVWPFEVLVVSRQHCTSLSVTDDRQRAGLAGILHEVAARYDRLFSTSFPYSMGMHQSPTDGQPHPEWHLHLHFYPPLLRSATVKKFMVGYEMLANPQRDITPEASAARLRDVGAPS